METLLENPYKVKLYRKLIDGCAFGMYSHWVKRGENQNRAAMFEHTLRDDWKRTSATDEKVPEIKVVDWWLWGFRQTSGISRLIGQWRFRSWAESWAASFVCFDLFLSFFSLFFKNIFFIKSWLPEPSTALHFSVCDTCMWQSVHGLYFKLGCPRVVDRRVQCTWWAILF